MDGRLVAAASLMAGLVALALFGASKDAPQEAFRPASERLESPILPAGESWSMTFRTVEDIPYECHPHPWMKGHLTIATSSGRPAQAWHVSIYENGTEWGFAPPHLTVEAGDTVTWTNNGTMIHTATRTTGHGGH